VDRVGEGGIDFEMDKKTVRLDEPLKSVGVSNVAVRLHPEVEVEIEIRVEREEG
jgi:large subunit ribosomal protein L9